MAPSGYSGWLASQSRGGSFSRGGLTGPERVQSSPQQPGLSPAPDWAKFLANWHPAGPAAAAAPAASPAPSPFLTSAQELAKGASDRKFQDSMANWANQLVQGGARLTSGLANSKLSHDRGQNNTNQSMAARGLFNSSIEQGATNDLATTWAIRDNALHTNYNNLAAQVAGNQSSAIWNHGLSNNYYNQLAADNAANIPVAPDTTTTTTAPAPTTSTGSPAPAQSSFTPIKAPGRSSIAGPKINTPKVPTIPKVPGANPNMQGGPVFNSGAGTPAGGPNW